MVKRNTSSDGDWLKITLMSTGNYKVGRRAKGENDRGLD